MRRIGGENPTWMARKRRLIGVLRNVSVMISFFESACNFEGSGCDFLRRR
jgi:hypothetical protein